jgi:hypothetical protein
MLVSVYECILARICNAYKIEVRHRIKQQTDSRVKEMNGPVKTLKGKLHETGLTNTNSPYQAKYSLRFQQSLNP